MKKKFTLDQIKINSFVTTLRSKEKDAVFGGLVALAGNAVKIAAGETLDEDPCTFQSIRAEDCNAR